MNTQILHNVWCDISAKTAGELWSWSLLGVKGLRELGNCIGAAEDKLVYQLSVDEDSRRRENDNSWRRVLALPRRKWEDYG